MMLAASVTRSSTWASTCRLRQSWRDARETGATLVGLSALLTTMVEASGRWVERMTEAGLRDRVRIAIGGACCTQALADEMGVDAYGESLWPLCAFSTDFGERGFGLIEEWRTARDLLRAAYRTARPDGMRGA
jgi:hypothetical protein